MKFYKLLFLFFALVGLNSCVEYVDNGKKNDGSENPEEKKFTAEHSNPDKAKYVGDTFEFKAMMNNTDVTSSTKFKVNGAEIKGNTYIAFKEGENSVVATMDNYTSNFKFKALKKDDTPDPEPKGNRIEYGGKSYPLSTNLWMVYFTADGKNLETQVINDVPHTVWLMYTSDNTDPKVAQNYVLELVFVPGKKESDGTYSIAYPNEVIGSSIIHVEGMVYINGAQVYETTNASFTIANNGNAPFPDFVPSKFPISANSNYTTLLTGDNSGNSSELFWNGSHSITGTLAAKTKNINNLKNIKPIDISKNQVKNIKLVK